MRSLFRARIKEPAVYSTKPAEALEAFCARYLEAVLYESSVQLLRISMAETTRFPEGAARHHDVVFTEVTARVSSYLKASFGLSARANEAAQRLLARLLFPRQPRALFGLEDLIADFDEHALSPKIDIKAVRKVVAEAIGGAPIGEPQRRPRVSLKHEGAAAWDHPGVVAHWRGLLVEGDIFAVEAKP